MSRALILDQNGSYFGNFSSSVLRISHNYSFPYQKIMVESPDKYGDTSSTWTMRRIK